MALCLLTRLEMDCSQFVLAISSFLKLFLIITRIVCATDQAQNIINSFNSEPISEEKTKKFYKQSSQHSHVDLEDQPGLNTGKKLFDSKQEINNELSKLQEPECVAVLGEDEGIPGEDDVEDKGQYPEPGNEQQEKEAHQLAKEKEQDKKQEHMPINKLEEQVQQRQYNQNEDIDEKLHQEEGIHADHQAPQIVRRICFHGISATPESFLILDNHESSVIMPQTEKCLSKFSISGKKVTKRVDDSLSRLLFMQNACLSDFAVTEENGGFKMLGLRNLTDRRCKLIAWLSSKKRLLMPGSESTIQAGKKYGVKFYDDCQGIIVDPHHNLFMGTFVDNSGMRITKVCLMQTLFDFSSIQKRSLFPAKKVLPKSLELKKFSYKELCRSYHLISNRNWFAWSKVNESNRLFQEGMQESGVLAYLNMKVKNTISFEHFSFGSNQTLGKCTKSQFLGTYKVKDLDKRIWKICLGPVKRDIIGYSEPQEGHKPTIKQIERLDFFMAIHDTYGIQVHRIVAIEGQISQDYSHLITCFTLQEEVLKMKFVNEKLYLITKGGLPTVDGIKQTSSVVTIVSEECSVKIIATGRETWFEKATQNGDVVGLTIKGQLALSVGNQVIVYQL